MHIAWLGKKSPFCGNVTYSREITNALLERGYRVTFLHFAQTSDNHQESHHPDCSEVSLPFLFKSQILTIPSFKSGKLLAEALKRLKPDLVHASLTLSPLDFRLPEICAELGLPLVATFHPAFDRKVRSLTSGTQHLTYQLYAPCLANYTRVIVFSDLQRDLLIRLGVPTNGVVVIPNGVDTRRYSPGPSSAKLDLKAQRLFVYQGRLSPEKNVEALLRGWRQADMGPGCKLAIVGSGPLEASLKLFYSDQDDIIWLGYLADEQQRVEILRGGRWVYTAVSGGGALPIVAGSYGLRHRLYCHRCRSRRGSACQWGWHCAGHPTGSDPVANHSANSAGSSRDQPDVGPQSSGTGAVPLYSGRQCLLPGATLRHPDPRKTTGL